MYVTVISMCGVADKHRMFNLVWVKVILKLHANCCCGESLIILLFAVSGLQREIEVRITAQVHVLAAYAQCTNVCCTCTVMYVYVYMCTTFIS